MFLEPKDFAKAIGIKDGTLRQHVRRKKVHKSGDYIDTNFELNKIYINDQTNGKGLDLSKIKSNPNDKNRTQNRKIEEPVVEDLESHPKTRDLTTEEGIQLSLDLQQKKINLEKSERDNELKRIEIAKKRGELMPIELVEKIMTINIQTLLRIIESEHENIASVWVEILGGSRTHLSKMVQEMRKILQTGIMETEQKSAEDIKAAIGEYAEVRGRGQKK